MQVLMVRVVGGTEVIFLPFVLHASSSQYCHSGLGQALQVLERASSRAKQLTHKVKLHERKLLLHKFQEFEVKFLSIEKHIPSHKNVPCLLCLLTWLIAIMTPNKGRGKPSFTGFYPFATPTSVLHLKDRHQSN